MGGEAGARGGRGVVAGKGALFVWDCPILRPAVDALPSY